MVLIGILGKKGSGKSTVANHLVDKYQFREFSFADCLKKACQVLFLLSDEQVFGTQEQKEMPDHRWFNCTPRTILQYVGTDLLREQMDKIMPGLGKDIFVHHFKLWYEAEIAKNPMLKVVISDVRFQNEVNIIHQLGGRIIKLDRSGIVKNDLHASEIEQQKITDHDYLIKNDGSLLELYKNVDKFLDSF